MAICHWEENCKDFLHEVEYPTWNNFKKELSWTFFIAGMLNYSVARQKDGTLNKK